MERPNTIAGLKAKQKELTAVRRRIEADLHKVICDLDHLDAAIKLFDPEHTPEARERYATQHRAPKGQLKRFVLAFLRNAGEAGGTTREITEAWSAARGLRTDDATFVMLRKRTGACLIALREQGMARNDGTRDGYVRYVL